MKTLLILCHAKSIPKIPTAELVAKGCKYEGDIVLNHSLYEAKPKDYMNILD